MFDLIIALGDVQEEFYRAERYAPFNSAHEGHGIIDEEYEELKVHVRMKQKDRDLDAMRKEAVQLAAMSVKFIQMIDDGRGRV